MGVSPGLSPHRGQLLILSRLPRRGTGTPRLTPPPARVRLMDSRSDSRSVAGFAEATCCKEGQIQVRSFTVVWVPLGKKLDTCPKMLRDCEDRRVPRRGVIALPGRWRGAHGSSRISMARTAAGASLAAGRRPHASAFANARPFAGLSHSSWPCLSRLAGGHAS